MQDCDIVSLYLSRDERAIRESQRKYGRYLTRIARNILGEGDCEECLDDVYLAAWHSIPPQEPEDLRTYLSLLTRRAALKYCRHAEKRGGGQTPLSLDELEDCLADGEEIGDRMEYDRLVAALNAYLATLPKPVEQLFLARYFYMDSLTDAAALVGMKPTAAKSALFRARNGLREYLKKEGFNP